MPTVPPSSVHTLTARASSRARSVRMWPAHTGQECTLPHVSTPRCQPGPSWTVPIGLRPQLRWRLSPWSLRSSSRKRQRCAVASEHASGHGGGSSGGRCGPTCILRIQLSGISIVATSCRSFPRNGEARVRGGSSSGPSCVFECSAASSSPGLEPKRTGSPGLSWGLRCALISFQRAKRISRSIRPRADHQTAPAFRDACDPRLLHAPPSVDSSAAHMNTTSDAKRRGRSNRSPRAGRSASRSGRAPVGARQCRAAEIRNSRSAPRG